MAKYLSNGTLIWFVSSEGPGASAGTSVTTDGQGNIYLAGAFAGTITIADSTLVSTNSSFDTFILKFNASGTLLRSLKIGGSENVIVNALAIDGSGNLLAVFDFKGQVNLAGNIFNSLEASDILLSKFDPNLTISWAQQAGGTANDIASSLVTDGSNNVYLTGIFFGIVNFGATVLDAGISGAGEFFLAKYNSLGNFQWAIQEGSASQPEEGNDIAYANNGDLIVTGSFTGSADFSGTILTSFGSRDIFLASYDTDGVLQWIKQAGGTADDEATSVTINSSGEIFLTGTFQDQADFGSVSVSSEGFQALFLAKCDPSGIFEWVLSVDGAIKGVTVQADSHDNMIIAGVFVNSILFGNTTITSGSGSQDIFIAKYAE
ncbi:MAG: hypothetical protein IPL46_09965 [Saprospiraceae bacterium]|nr:hypothetical protein [Saprospiraceae bacterium]